MAVVPRRERSVTGEPPVAEAGAAPGVGLGRRLVTGDPAGDHLRGDRGHEDAGPEVPRGQPRVAQAWHPVDDRAPVRVTRPEAAPLVGGLQAADRRQGGVQGLEDGFDHLGPYLGGFVAGVEGPPDQQPPVLQLGGDGGDRARQAQRRRLGASRWPLTWLAGRSSGSPSSSGGSPVANTTAPGVISPEVVVTEASRSPLTATEMAAMPVATAGRPAASRASDRSGLTLAWWRMSAPAIGRARPGTRLATSPGSSHSTAGWRWGAKPPGSGARPIQSSSTKPTPPGTVSSSWLHRSRLALASSTNGSGSLHSCGSGVSRPAAPPVAPDPSRPASMRSTEPRSSSWHATAVATPAIPPPTTRMSGRVSGMTPAPRPSSARSCGVS